MKRITIIALAIIASATIASAGEQPTDTWSAANASYAAGDYPEAITAYESLLTQTSGHDRAEVYYNLGNAYYKQGELGQSVLAYERCLRLAPGMGDARANLAFVEGRITDRIEDNHSFFLQDWVLAVRNRLREPVWLTLSVVCWVVCLIGVLGFLFLGDSRWRRVAFHAAWPTLLMALCFAIAATTLHSRDTERREAIVMRGAVAAKSSPDRSGTDLFTVHEGTKVHIRETLGEWSEIHIGQYMGWVETKHLERI